MGRLLIVSNRLPVSCGSDGTLVRSSGGLVSALSSLTEPYHWVGCLGAEPPCMATAQASLRAQSCSAVEMPIALYNSYYLFCNNSLWPRLHFYTPSTEGHDGSGERSYLQAATHFASAVEAVYQPGDVIWVHDYHLFTLPSLLRARLPQARIGFFLHTPFPSSALFGQLSLCLPFLRGLLSCDLVGFHTHGYAAHFLSACTRYLPGTTVTACSAASASGAPAATRVVVLPIGIDPTPFTACLSGAPATTPTLHRLAELRSYFGPDRKLIIAVDRLDPIKGLLQRLRGFQRFLSTFGASHPPGAQPPCLLAVAVPSREACRDYKQLRLAVEALTSSINAQHGVFGQPPPVSLFYRSISHSELCSLLALGSACLITSLRDGLNLVASEYCCTQQAVLSSSSGRAPGVLILSEFAGAATCLPGAILVNPHAPEEVAAALELALYAMPPAQAARRHAANMDFILSNTSSAWAGLFLAALPPPPPLALQLLQQQLLPWPPPPPQPCALPCATSSPCPPPPSGCWCWTPACLPVTPPRAPCAQPCAQPPAQCQGCACWWWQRRSRGAPWQPCALSAAW